MYRIIENNLSNIIAFFAIIISIITIFYSRKNLKTQKYIDTITRQRINWIEELRNDLSKILSFAIMINYNNWIINYEREEGLLDPSDPEKYDELTSFLKLKNKELTEIKSNTFIIINLIELSILKLNSEKDISLIKLLDELKLNYISQSYNKINDALIKNLRNQIKLLLKKEWEKVKLETTKGGNSYEKRKLNIYNI